MKKGFSLIELSLLLVVISSLATVAITRYVAREKIANQERVFKDFEAVRAAINAYVRVHGYYPCPAIPQIQRNNTIALVGARYADGHCVAAASDTRAWGVTDFGLSTAVYSSDTTTDYVTPPASSAKLRIGVVPCRELGLPMDCGVSPEGDRYAYQVSARLTIPQDCKYYATVAGATAVAPIPDPVRALAAGDGTGLPDPSNRFGGGAGVPLSCTGAGTVDDTVLDNYYGDNVNTNYTAGDYVLIYFGPDGIGAYKDNSTNDVLDYARRNRPNEILGAKIGDNKCQDMNHKMFSTTLDNYFLMPRIPFHPEIVFGDVVYAGRSDYFVPTFCVLCTYCAGGTYAKVIKVQNSTDVLPYTSSTTSATLCALTGSGLITALGTCQP